MVNSRIAGIDELAVLEMQLVDEARDAGAHLDRGDRLEAARRYSSHCVTRLAIGGAMLTGMAGRAALGEGRR